MYCIQYVYQYRCRLRCYYRFQNQTRPRFTRPTLIANISPWDTYGGLPIRHTDTTLDSTHPVVLSSWDTVSRLYVTTRRWYRRTHNVEPDFAVSHPGVVRQRRQHDALCTLVFGYNVRFHSTLTFSVDLYGSLSIVVRDGHPLNHKPCPSPRPGVGRMARG